MKTRTTLFICILLIISGSTKLFAQDKNPVKYGKVSIEELKMSSYDKDPNAEAVVLSDDGLVNFYYNESEGFIIEHTRTCRIKIFNDDGYDWADHSIYLYNNNSIEEKVATIKGFTYNLEGGKIEKSKLEKSSVFEEKTSKYRTKVSFTMPNVKEGSVIEFTYKISTNYFTAIPSWEFQKSIPVAWSEYTVKIPEYFTYLQNMQGGEPFHISDKSEESGNITFMNTTRTGGTGFSNVQTNYSTNRINYRVDIFRWVTKDLPALKDEAFVGNYKNYVNRVDFVLASTNFPGSGFKNVLGTWESIVDKFLHDYEDFGPNMKKKSFYKDITDPIMAKYQKPEERLAAIYSYVNQSIKWNGKYDLIPDANIKNTYNNRTGNAAEMNALLISMLNAVDVEADAVILSTVDNGLVHPVYPIITQYNYMIARATINGKSILMDASEKNMPPGMLPQRCLNKRGYAISETRPGWVDLTPSEGQTQIITGKFNIEGDLLKGNFSISEGGYTAISTRKKIQNKGFDKFLEDYKENHPQYDVEEYTIDSTNQDPLKLNKNIQLNIKEKVSTMGDLMYINPFVFVQQDENIFKQEERKLPVDFIMPMNETLVCSFDIPDGYTVDELPKSLKLAIPGNGIVYDFVIRQESGIIQLKSQLTIKKIFFTPEEYTDIRDIFTMIMSKQNEQIVLKKSE